MEKGNSNINESILRMVDMRTLEQRRIEQSLIVFLIVLRIMAQLILITFLKPRIISYNLRMAIM